MAKLIIYTLQPSLQNEASKGLQDLKQLFDSIDSYYYPSNSGNWSGRLARFLIAICESYAKRVGKGKHKAQDKRFSMNNNNNNNELLIQSGMGWMNRATQREWHQAIFNRPQIIYWNRARTNQTSTVRKRGHAPCCHEFHKASCLYVTCLSILGGLERLIILFFFQSSRA